MSAEKLDRVFRPATRIEEAMGVLGMPLAVKGGASQRSDVLAHVLENTTSLAVEAIRAVFAVTSRMIARLAGYAVFIVGTRPPLALAKQ